MTDEVLTTLAEKVDLKHAALIVVDVQNDFCADGGFFHRTGRDMSMIQPMVPRLVQFLERTREVGLRTVFIQSTYDERFNSGPMKERNRRRGVEIPRCITGSWGADFYLVKPQQQEFVVEKHRYSAFAGTKLDLLLRSQGIKTLIMTGVATNVCVESTARDGFFLDYYIVFLKDLCATDSQFLHDATLENIDSLFGVVCTSAEVLVAWKWPGVVEVPAK